jgi:hypothetical protein
MHIRHAASLPYKCRPGGKIENLSFDILWRIRASIADQKRNPVDFFTPSR